MQGFDKELPLHEAIFLMAVDDENGKVHTTPQSPWVLACSIAAELLLDERLGMEGSGSPVVSVRDGKPTGDAVLDEALARVSAAERPAALRSWVGRFRGLPHLTRKVAAGLCHRRILHEEEERFLFFRRHLYDHLDGRAKRRLVERVRNAVFSETGDLDPRTALLVAGAATAGLLKACFADWQLADRRERISQIVKGEILTGGMAAIPAHVIPGILSVLSILRSPST